MFRASIDLMNGVLETVSGFIDSGGDAGIMELRTAAGTLLAELRFSHPSAESVAGGLLVLRPLSPDRAARASGLATIAQIRDSDKNLLFECDVSDVNGAASVKLTTNQIQAGGPITISSFTLAFDRGE